VVVELSIVIRSVRTVANGEGEVLLAPSSGDGVDITAADTAALNLDIDVVVAERLGLELVLVEFQPRVRSIDLEAGELLWVRHLGGLRRSGRGEQYVRSRKISSRL
jgi:outer membrane protein W